MSDYWEDDYEGPAEMYEGAGYLAPENPAADSYRGMPDEMSILAGHTGGDVPGGKTPEPDYSSFREDSGDGGDYANEPQPDRMRELQAEAVLTSLDLQEQQAATRAELAQKFSDVEAFQAQQEQERGTTVMNGMIDQHYGHSGTSQASRDLIHHAAEALLDEVGPRLRSQGFAESKVAAVCVEQAIELVKNAEVSHNALKKI